MTTAFGSRRTATRARRCSSPLAGHASPPTFEGRTLPVEAQVALKCAALHVPNRCKERDFFSAATAMVRGMTVVTRDMTDFASTGATMFNP